MGKEKLYFPFLKSVKKRKDPLGQNVSTNLALIVGLHTRLIAGPDVTLLFELHEYSVIILPSKLTLYFCLSL